MTIDINSYDLYIGLAINGIFTGLGVAIGTYIANNAVIRHGKKLRKRIVKNIFKKIFSKIKKAVVDNYLG